MSMHPTDTTPDKQTLSQLMDGEWQDIDRSACVAGLCRDAALKDAWARWHVARDALRGEPVTPAPPGLAERIRAAVDAEPAYSNVTPWPGTAPTASAASAARPEGTASGAPGVAAAAFASPGTPPDAPIPPAASAGHGGARVSRLGLTGFALAASAALVTVVGLNAWQGADAPGGASGAGAGDALALGPVVPDGAPAEAPGTDPVAAALRLDEAFAGLDPLPEVDLVANTGGPGGASGSYWVAGDSGVRRSASEDRLNAFLSRHIESSPTAAQPGMLPYSRLVGYDGLAAAPASPVTGVGPVEPAGAGAER